MEGAANYFNCIEDVRYDVPTRYYAMRYFKPLEYFQRSFDPPTNGTERLKNMCPGPRITTFLKGCVYFPYTANEEIIRHISYDIQSATPMFWNQIAYDHPGEGCRFAVDIDAKRVLTDEDVHLMANILWRTLQEYYPNVGDRPAFYLSRTSLDSRSETTDLRIPTTTTTTTKHTVRTRGSGCLDLPVTIPVGLSAYDLLQ